MLTKYTFLTFSEKFFRFCNLFFIIGNFFAKSHTYPILLIWRSTKEFSRGYWTCNFCCWPGHPVIYCNLGHFPGLKISILLLSFRTYIKVIFPKYWKHQLFSCESVASLFHRDNPSADPYKFGGQCFLLLRWCLHVKWSTPNRAAGMYEDIRTGPHHVFRIQLTLSQPGGQIMPQSSPC